MTKIFSPNGDLLAAREIARWANKVHRQAGGKGNVFDTLDFVHSTLPRHGERLKGHHCCCGVDSNGYSNGEFVLLPLDDEAVIVGGKAYMVCKKCNSFSHL